ncbi:reverse transcriptase domain-containing protein [Tanacetum coccineum]
MYLVEIVKFCDATLEKVLKEVELKIFLFEPWKKEPLLGELDLDIFRAFEREITKRLRHREQMRKWESFVNERPILPTMKRLDVASNQLGTYAYGIKFFFKRSQVNYILKSGKPKMFAFYVPFSGNEEIINFPIPGENCFHNHVIPIRREVRKIKEAKVWLDELNEGTIETIAENTLVEVGKFTFLLDFVILEMKDDSKVPFILRRPFLNTADVVIRVKQKELNLGVGSQRMTFSIGSVMKHSYSDDDTCFSIDVINEILEEDFDALLDEGVKSFIPSRELSSKKNSLLNSMNSWL